MSGFWDDGITVFRRDGFGYLVNYVLEKRRYSGIVSLGKTAIDGDGVGSFVRASEKMGGGRASALPLSWQGGGKEERAAQ